MPLDTSAGDDAIADEFSDPTVIVLAGVALASMYGVLAVNTLIVVLVNMEGVVGNVAVLVVVVVVEDVVIVVDGTLVVVVDVV